MALIVTTTTMIMAIAIPIGGPMTSFDPGDSEVVISTTTVTDVTIIDVEETGAATENDDVGDKVTIEPGVLVVIGSISITVERLEITVASWYGIISCCVIMGV